MELNTASVAEVKNAWSCTSTCPYAFMEFTGTTSLLLCSSTRPHGDIPRVSKRHQCSTETDLPNVFGIFFFWAVKSSDDKASPYTVLSGKYKDKYLPHRILLRVWPKHVFRRVRKIAKSDYYLRHVRPSVCPSARMEQHGSCWNNFD